MPSSPRSRAYREDRPDEPTLAVLLATTRSGFERGPRRRPEHRAGARGPVRFHPRDQPPDRRPDALDRGRGNRDILPARSRSRPGDRAGSRRRPARARAQRRSSRHAPPREPRGTGRNPTASAMSSLDAGSSSRTRATASAGVDWRTSMADGESPKARPKRVKPDRPRPTTSSFRPTGGRSRPGASSRPGGHARGARGPALRGPAATCGPIPGSPVVPTTGRRETVRPSIDLPSIGLLPAGPRTVPPERQ